MYKEIVIIIIRYKESLIVVLIRIRLDSQNQGRTQQLAILNPYSNKILRYIVVVV